VRFGELVSVILSIEEYGPNDQPPEHIGLYFIEHPGFGYKHSAGRFHRNSRPDKCDQREEVEIGADDRVLTLAAHH